MKTPEKVNRIRELYKTVFSKEAYPEKIFEQIAYYWHKEREKSDFLVYLIRTDLLPNIEGKPGLKQMIESHIEYYEKEKNEV